MDSPQNISAGAGTNVTFNCTVRCPEGFTTWSYNNSTETAREDRFSTDSSAGQIQGTQIHSLIFMALSKDNGARIRCHIPCDSESCTSNVAILTVITGTNIS